MSDKVRASSENHGNLARYAVDGNLSTFWTPVLPRKRRDILPTIHWLEVDLGRIETVHAVTLRSGLGCLDGDIDDDDDDDEYDYEYNDLIDKYNFHR